jgi:hypothetical protein
MSTNCAIISNPSLNSRLCKHVRIGSTRHGPHYYNVLWLEWEIRRGCFWLPDGSLYTP